MRTIATIAAAVLLALTAGCSGGSDDGGSAATLDDGSASVAMPTVDGADDGGVDEMIALPDPCALLTTADLAEATGLTFGEGTYNETLSAENRAICDWISDDPFATAQTLIFANADFEGNRASAAEVSGEPLEVQVTGAARAYQTPEGSIVAMEIGEYFVQVAYIPPGPGNVNAATLALAEKVAGRV